MPTTDEVHAIPDVGAPAVYPPSSVTVVVPSSTAGTAVVTQASSLFANEEYFYAKCNATDVVGAAVYANTTVAFVTTADAESPTPVVGFIVAKSSPTDCTVQRYGECDLTFANLSTGKRYFLGDKGSICTPPFPSDSIEFVQQIGTAISSTQLFIQPTGTVVRRDLGDVVADHNPWLTGNRDPLSTDGSDGDLWLNETTGTLFGPKAMGAWPQSGVNLTGPSGPRGPQGLQGDVGPQGPPGQGIQGVPGQDGIGYVFGQGSPAANSTIPQGSAYVDTLTNEVYYPAD